MTDWMEAVRVAITGFSIVFLCLAILMVVIKIMSFLLRPVRRQEALEAGDGVGAGPAREKG
jgi:Na+-transporting methylmalonyl-CoA/oxaloacetate decarboxylase gamma subunit